VRRQRSTPLPLGALAVGLALAGCASLPPYETVRARVPAEEMLALDGRSVHVQQLGDRNADAVVLLHGFGESTYTFRNVAPALAERYRVIAIDLNGFGYTDRPRDPASYTLDGQQRLVLAVLDRLGVDRAHFLGHSYGGGLTLWIAAHHPERVRSMVLVATTLPRYSTDQRTRLANLRPFSFLYLRTVVLRERFVRESLEAAYEDDSLVTPEVVRAVLDRLRVAGVDDAYHGLLAERGEPPAIVDLGAIEKPALVVWGREDRRTSVRNGERFAAALPWARLVVIDGSGHVPMEEKPRELLAAVLPFLADPSRVRGGGDLAVRCGRLIDGLADEVRSDVWVTIHGGTIVGVGAEAPAGDMPTLDLGAKTCLPGLLDLHTHLTDSPEDTKDLRVYLTRPDEEALARGREHARATLLAGFTTVRDVGTYIAWTDRALRDAIRRAETPGPRMQVAGMYLTVPGGGGDLLIPGVPERDVPARVRRGVARGAGAFRSRAEEAVAGGADVLKVIASGAVLAYGGVPGAPEMSVQEIRAVAEVAHAHGRRLAAHAHGARSVRDAIRAGADTVEHASLIDAEGIALAKARGVCLVMDVYNGDFIDTEGRRQGWPEEFLRKNVETTEVQRVNFGKAVAAGATVAYGTDAAVYPHGLNARQFRVMVERGMTPMQAIRAATSVAARCMGWGNRVGALRPGLAGDLVAVDGDPLRDVGELERVTAVVQDGRVVLPPPPSP
jgi:imidazolonepropionase-like amidohydrolase/pimeloyl-ACP methyl ester carboxylesterase